MGFNLMNSCKILPELYNYVRYGNWHSLLCQTSHEISKGAKLRLDIKQLEKGKFSKAEILDAYKTYAQSPYINQYLRNGEVVSENNNRLIECLKQGIRESEAVQGQFYRGITGNRKTRINDETIFDFVFNNKGFTSTAPKGNKHYAETFATGNNSATIIYDIDRPMKALQQNPYEVLFDTNAFTSDKFSLEKIKEGIYRVFPKI